MACYHPIDAYRCLDGSIVFVELRKHDILQELKIPCGQCVGCRIQRSRQWAIRCMHESQLHEENCFITLTFNDDHLPVNNSLFYRDFQLFMKRLRLHFSPRKIRFYMCGEYGENFGRPHFHACLFGINFPDRVLWRKSPSGLMLYRSDILEKLWPFGFSSIGDVTFESAAYVARYIMKKVTGKNAQTHYVDFDHQSGEVFERIPEFNRMSLKPGIGADWFKHYKTDVFPGDYVVIKGQKLKTPRYYDKLFKDENPFEFDEILYKRYLKGVKLAPDSTPDRLAVREQVQLARLDKLKRTLT